MSEPNKSGAAPDRTSRQPSISSATPVAQAAPIPVIGETDRRPMQQRFPVVPVIPLVLPRSNRPQQAASQLTPQTPTQAQPQQQQQQPAYGPQQHAHAPTGPRAMGYPQPSVVGNQQTIHAPAGPRAMGYAQPSSPGFMRNSPSAPRAMPLNPRTPTGPRSGHRLNTPVSQARPQLPTVPENLDHPLPPTPVSAKPSLPSIPENLTHALPANPAAQASTQGVSPSTPIAPWSGVQRRPLDSLSAIREEQKQEQEHLAARPAWVRVASTQQSQSQSQRQRQLPARPPMSQAPKTPTSLPPAPALLPTPAATPTSTANPPTRRNILATATATATPTTQRRINLANFSALSSVASGRVSKSRAPSNSSTSSSSKASIRTKSSTASQRAARLTRKESPEARVSKLAKSLDNSHLNIDAPAFLPAVAAVVATAKSNATNAFARKIAEKKELDEMVLQAARDDLAASMNADRDYTRRERGWRNATDRQRDLMRAKCVAGVHGRRVLERNGYRPGVGTPLPGAAAAASGGDGAGALPRVVAMDCEMVAVVDPLDPNRDQYPVRICVVDVLSGEILLDHVIIPPEHMAVDDWRTKWSGMTQAVMELYHNAGRSLQGIAGALSALSAILDQSTVFIGHALHNDFRALELAHGQVIDTALVTLNAVNKEYRDAKTTMRCKRTWKLSYLMEEFLNRKIQDGHHGCLEDTFSVREWVLWYVLEASAVGIVQTWARAAYNRGDHPIGAATASDAEE
ncbi:hypothetical protein BJX64DRAFT_294968 [Aspergillus heterothallicus]